ncbi:hypothetical protein LEP1GSC016_2266 [Leptospira borgpetersenii serovar Hardjo-bovis str. Sponselee]|uniref:Uncharacterized protein n=7 Tax=Leptospira borgpetersenii TaxID=174 RepID=M3GZV7_LEPBO|nr:hypothetical protein LBBP_03489 [Leptospira borgpetersenii serovar Ballum]EKP14539.1 hypothetical protein LEP1GSC128_1821 [Leptospira borgpetersenii str. 200801926]EKQ92699.1 hypothetical protein LEP1GSC101_2534 [Leptospira borgpetersenii str. UI 09149]EKQ99911.1 hypothetical protein LEP1GSC121_1829 [Leptospira borgpetersenii serovar Castellonis str. 200801910]EMG00379.1 hypothetical protein LEP1GSC123_2355 [Leptospira borgpetersenii str. 200701203]EMJ81987.1 hypothetical protein LEP1GSC016
MEHGSDRATQIVIPNAVLIHLFSGILSKEFNRIMNNRDFTFLKIMSASHLTN